MPSSADLAAWDHAYLWHPFTQMRDWLAEEPLVVVAGEGNYLIDTHGRRYLDGISSLWCNVHGHRRRELDEALKAQIDRIAHSTLLGLASAPSIELARRLVEITPARLTRVFYSDAGATAVEIALKIAFQYWHLRGDRRRTRFASLVEAYHGDTIGAVSVGYSELFHHPFKPLLFDCHKLTPPHVYRWQHGMTLEQSLKAAIADAAALFERHGRDLAALIVEPLMQGAAGMWAQPVGYMRALRELTKTHGVLLICDEVATGFGRTGKMFAVEHDGVEPDLMCLGKGLSAGYLPLAATLSTEEIFEAFLAPYEDFKTFFHGHTYTGNALACAVALANLDIFENEQVVRRVERRAAEMQTLLERHVAPVSAVGDIRQWGLMVGIELVSDRRTKAAHAPAARVPQRVVAQARRRGVIIRPLGNVIVLMPPLSISSPELEALCSVTADAIDEATKG